MEEPGGAAAEGENEAGPRVGDSQDPQRAAVASPEPRVVRMQRRAFVQRFHGLDAAAADVEVTEEREAAEVEAAQLGCVREVEVGWTGQGSCGRGLEGGESRAEGEGELFERREGRGQRGEVDGGEDGVVVGPQLGQKAEDGPRPDRTGREEADEAVVGEVEAAEGEASGRAVGEGGREVQPLQAVVREVEAAEAGGRAEDLDQVQLVQQVVGEVEVEPAGPVRPVARPQGGEGAIGEAQADRQAELSHESV